jgi:hypothetical protein
MKEVLRLIRWKNLVIVVLTIDSDALLPVIEPLIAKISVIPVTGVSLRYQWNFSHHGTISSFYVLATLL